MSKRLVLVILGSLFVLVGAACSNDDPAVDAGSGSGSGSASADHNEADVTFAQSMIPHHEGALEMAKLAPTRAADQRVKDLATKIEAAQTPEIELMRGWLKDWDAAGDGGGMDMGGSGDSGASGMNKEEMTELEEAKGAEFDTMFLTAMIGHHKSAVKMAETEIADGKFPAALELARKIKTAQEAEITEMETLLAELS